MSKTKSQSGKGVGGNGHISRKALYAKISRKAPQVIDFLFETMNDEKTQKSVRLSAANKLIDKVLPNITQNELVGEEGKSIQVIVRDYTNLVTSEHIAGESVTSDSLYGDSD